MVSRLMIGCDRLRGGEGSVLGPDCAVKRQLDTVMYKDLEHVYSREETCGGANPSIHPAKCADPLLSNVFGSA